MCTPHSEGDAYCATHTRPGYLAVMVEADALPASDLRRRIDAHPSALLHYASTKAGAQTLANDIYSLERHYEHALAAAPFYVRGRLRRDQQAVLSALNAIHGQAHVVREAVVRGAAVREAAEQE